MEIIYLARYLSCVYESSWYTLSVHRTMEGAEESVRMHTLENIGKDGSDYGQQWDVEKVELKD